MKSIRRHFFSADSFFAILLDNQRFIKVYNAMQHISSNVGSIRLERIRQEVIKKAEKSRIVTMALCCDMPRLNNLWWIWLLSGRNGLLPILMRWMKTLTTSIHGTSNGPNARKNGWTLERQVWDVAISTFAILKLRNDRMSPMVNEPVSPMNIFCCFSAFPNTL